MPARQRLNDIFASHAFDVYRRNNDTITAQFRKDYQSRDVLTEVIGVWDTVGALGIPLAFFSGLDHLLFSFHDTSLHPNVRFGYHAVAIDESGKAFRPPCGTRAKAWSRCGSPESIATSAAVIKKRACPT
ncbi:MAG TPA: DUF2235 domain-containing protein [Nitrospira sp.]|nr:DUF2235 domain-containing protein [Nitrospira sp.]